MPSPLKRSQRKRRDARTGLDAATSPTSLEDSSPSRPVKRRKKLDTSDDADPSPVAFASSTHGEAASPDADEGQTLLHVMEHFKSLPIQAAKDHANAIHEAKSDGVKAYAKVAALEWTFYITNLAVNIGRAPEAPSAAATRGRGGSDDNDIDTVHIDLGPSKMVSREHAAICFDSKEETWFLHVKGRNGAKVDGEQLKSGVSHPLASGEVIEVGNVEMMFVLPAEISPPSIHPIFLERAGMNHGSPRPQSHRGRALIAPTAPRHERPGTPPSTQRHVSVLSAKSSVIGTPAVMIGPNGVDLSLDENQHIKPQYSYAQMITQAILNAPDGKLNLNGIYTHIINSYSYYRHQQAAGWQNSIRHNLSLNKAFDKVARSLDEPGKGMKWQIVSEAQDDMVRNAYRIGRGGHRGSSAPSSPSQLNYITHGPKDVTAREPSSARRRRGSPLASPLRRTPLNFNVVKSTPDRHSERQHERNAGLVADGSPLPRSKKMTPVGSSMSSRFQPQSPTLVSSYLQDDGGSFVTPAPPRVHPRLAPPSTAQRPSQHMLTSSPAPFWKYADIGSTPMKPMTPYEFSPTRPTRGMPPESSSPPAGNTSPPSSPTRPQKQDTIGGSEPPKDDDQGNGFDLTKGFQSIGTYHAPVEQGVPISNVLAGR